MTGQASWRVTLLGTGGSTGVPSLGGPDGHGDWGSCDPGEGRNRRTRSSCVIESSCGARLLVDAGPDCRQQLLVAGIGHVDAVAFTHAHADHVMGLDELRQINRIIGQALPAYAFPETLAELRERFAYAFLPPTRGFMRPALEGRALNPFATFPLGTSEITALPQDHRVARTMGLRLGTFAYSTDVVAMPEATLDALHGLACWVVGCFREEPHPVHAGLAQVLAWQTRVQARRVILTHMGNTMDWARLSGVLPPAVEPGHDQFTIWG